MRITTLALLLAATACRKAPEVCQPGDLLERACGVCGVRVARCDDQQTFGDFGDCVEPDSCSEPADTTVPEDTTEDTTVPEDTTEDTTVPDDTPEDTPVPEDTDAAADTDPLAALPCEEGDRFISACGSCGERERRCEQGAWTAWSTCTDEGECPAGSLETEACGTDEGACVAGTRERSCSATCAWEPWSECGGAGFVPPAPEVCNDLTDNDCNTRTDEGCACSPVAQGAGRSIQLAFTPLKLLADPQACFVYALIGGPSSQVVVFDVASKAELTRVPLGYPATDLDISPNGDWLIAAHDNDNRLSVINKSLWSVASVVNTTSDPYRVAVDDQGYAWYTELDQWVDIRGVGPGSADTVLVSWDQYAPAIDYAPTGSHLYVGESGISGGNLYKYQVSPGTATQVDVSTWDDGYGFSYPSRYVYVGPSGEHVYYAGHQLQAQDLSIVTGDLGERVWVEDAAATFAVSETAIWDAQIVQPAATLRHRADAAVLVASDRELWSYNAASGRIYYENIDDYLFGVPLGQRERAPRALSAYQISQLLHDPTRDRLYGLDATAGVIVFLEEDGTPTLEIVIGSGASDMAVDPNGTALYVGYSEALGLTRVDLTTDTWAAFYGTPTVTDQVEALADDFVAIGDYDQWTSVTLLNGLTGAQLDQAYWAFYSVALGASADGLSLFAGEARISSGSVTRYDVSRGSLDEVGVSSSYSYPDRSVVALPDGSGVYYAGRLLEGGNLTVSRYTQTGTILAVTPDGRLAFTNTTAYDVATGASLGPLPTTSSVMAASPDSATLFVITAQGLLPVDLTAY